MMVVMMTMVVVMSMMMSVVMVVRDSCVIASRHQRPQIIALATFYLDFTPITTMVCWKIRMMMALASSPSDHR